MMIAAPTARVASAGKAPAAAALFAGTQPDGEHLGLPAALDLNFIAQVFTECCEKRQNDPASGSRLVSRQPRPKDVSEGEEARLG
jgi:hypothetical protein